MSDATPHVHYPEGPGEYCAGCFEQGEVWAKYEERGRVLELIDDAMHVYRAHAGARGALYALRCRVADAIERGEHE